ncbi:hypothetical protein C0Q70_09721 [Pomacea canaliculata]|uniref:PDZ domain-containing protein n=1 Tax=Pomacea canaliculata TaxID=400727 RepID=A0A2T7PAK2_POMCA|nr:hypothetical protein C0Q70_09721 [Pomacea canaliculata]
MNLKPATRNQIHRPANRRTGCRTDKRRTNRKEDELTVIKSAISLFPEKRETTASPEPFVMESLQEKVALEHNSKTPMMTSQLSVDKYNMVIVQERARLLLNGDESDAVLRHISSYHDNHDVERLVEMLIAILDKPEKIQILKDIRGVIYAHHVGLFDSLVARHESTTFEKLSTKVHLPLNPVYRQDSAAKPRSKLITTVLDADGHFHIKTLEQHERNIRQQTDAVMRMRLDSQEHSLVEPRSTSNISKSQVHGSTTTISNSVSSRLAAPPDWRDDIEVIIVEKEPPPQPPSPPKTVPVEEGTTIYLSKQKKNLGLIVCGGVSDHRDPSIRIEMVMPWGAAADEDRVQPGMQILSADDQSLKGMTQSEAIAVLKSCFNDKRIDQRQATERKQHGMAGTVLKRQMQPSESKEKVDEMMERFSQISHGHREEGWQTKDKQPFLISPEKLQAFRNALKGSEKFRPKWPQSDTDLSHDDEEKMREPDIVKERRLISHTGQEQGHLAITEHNVEVEMEELEESEVFQMDIDAENRYTPPGSVVHTNIPEFSVPGEPCGNQNLVTPAKHFEHSATAAGMRQVLTNMQDRCSTSMKSVYLETCDEFSHHTRRQGSSESSSSSPPVLEPIYGKESKQPELVKLHQMGTQNTTITLSKEASSLSVLPRQGNRRFSKSSEEAVCHSNSLDSSRHQDQHDTLDATAQNSRNTQEPVSAKLKEKSVTALPHPFDASKHCADHERVDFFDDIYNGAVIPSFSSDSSDDELSEGLDSPLKFSAAHHSSPSSRCDSLSLQHNSNLVDEATPDTSIHSFSTAQPAAQYSLDYLLMETKKNEAVNKEIQTLQEKLQRGILLGGFEAVGENECNSDDDGLSAEHREALEKLKLNYSHIPEVHPGEVVLLATGCGRIFNEALSPLRCGFSPSNNSSLEKEIANIQPAYVSDLICSGVISMTSLSCKESLMRWMFFLSSVHSNGIIALKCVEEIAEMIQWHMETNRPECNTWSPEISDILRIFVNWGAKPEKVIFDQSVVCNINQLSEVLDEGHSVPQPKVTYRNIEAVLRVLSSCLQARPSYSNGELTQLLLMLCKLALDPMLSNQILQYEIQVCLSSVMKCYSLKQWLTAVPSLSHQLARLTSHHHNHKQLCELAENFQGLISEIKDNLRMMDIAKVKDMMLCMRSKWLLALKCANERQRSLFSCWSKPTKMNVERVEASVSHDESDEDVKEEQNTLTTYMADADFDS